MFSRFMGKSAPAPSEGAGQPLQLVSYDESTKQFTVGQEALKVLQGVRAPVGVVSVCGRARQGKSFILNQLLGMSSGFTVAPTHRPCTKGLWMWSAPVERVGADGSKHYLVRSSVHARSNACCFARAPVLGIQCTLRRNTHSYSIGAGIVPMA